jgi:HEAT repeat protein
MGITPDLRQRLAEVVARLAPASQAIGQLDVDRILGTGAQCYADLLAVAADERVDAEVRAAACWCLGRLGERQAVPALVASLQQQDAGVRQAAVGALGELGELASQDALAPLLALLATEANTDVGRAIIYALGLIGDRRALAPLVDVLRDRDRPALLRAMAAEALADLRDPTAVDPLIAALSDELAEVRFFAAFALGEIGDTRALPALQERIDRDDANVVPGYSSVRDEAARAREKILRAGR